MMIASRLSAIAPLLPTSTHIIEDTSLLRLSWSRPASREAEAAAIGAAGHAGAGMAKEIQIDTKDSSPAAVACAWSEPRDAAGGGAGRARPTRISPSRQD